MASNEFDGGHGSVGISADFSEIKELQVVLAAARERPHKVRAAALDKAADATVAEASAITAAYPSPIDELASNIEQEGTPVFRRIYTNKRQGHFLHFGSPKTGAPRDWLHGPAQKNVDEMLTTLADAAAIFP